MRSARKSIILLAIALLISLNGLSAQEGSTESEIPSFKTDVWPIFVTKCNIDDCHGKRGSAFPKYAGHAIIRAKSKKILKRIADERDPMPPAESPKPITKEEIENIRKWVEAGAPNNSP